MVRTFPAILTTILLLISTCLFSSAQVGVLHTVIVDETVRLSGQYLGNILEFSGGSRWVIKGVSNSTSVG